MAAQSGTGHCGHSCENSLADDKGMVEYDLLTETILGYHAPAMEANAGNSAPHVSPKGDYVVLMGGTGSHVDVLMTQGNGELAINAGSIHVGFQDGGGQSISDVEFIEDGTHNIAIFVATTDNFIVLADMRGIAAWDGTGMPPPVPTKKINLQDDNTESSSGHGRGAVRSVVWAPGTNSVMINSGALNQLHLLELASDGSIHNAAITKTITGVHSRYMVYVNDHTKPHSVCDEKYWMGPAKAAGWIPQDPVCAADSAWTALARAARQPQAGLKGRIARRCDDGATTQVLKCHLHQK